MTQETPKEENNNKEKALSMLQAGEWTSIRSALETPDLGGDEVRFDSKDLALAIVFAALYAALVIVQGQTAAATIQLRIADCLIPLCALFGWPAIAGVTAGALASNMFTSLSMSNGVYDVAFGPLANLLAGITVYVLRRRRLTACVLASVEIGLIVGSYVWMIFGSPSNIFNVGIPINWPFWAASIVSITISSLIAIAVIGYVLLSILSRKNTVLSLKSRGLKVILLKSEPLHESFQFCQSNDLVKIQAQCIKDLVKCRM